MLSLKRRPLKKADKVHYSITGFPHALLIWAYESILTIVGKFTTKHIEANLHMLSWTSTDNVKFDAAMSALTAVGEKQNPMDVPQAPRKIPVTQPNIGFLDSNIGVVADKGVKAAMDFLNANKEDKDEEKEDEEEDEEEEENEDDERENNEEILKNSMS
ncbi:hypothetical protein TIFTF001_020524 [Ficus carica]|uniref:Uncharacterized protein n=1 Tax=Ficus carica TaxID=3494 RepID=A0AA88AY31_FICCA|nr:hypothetical protein TIFTF001_020524 [Ficus carica]